VLAAEHRIYPLALKLIAEGRVRVIGERAIVDSPAPVELGLANPPN
jgi:phosphoribosylglycinamide formyltransferase-1